MSARSPVAERLAIPDAVLTSSDLAELGYSRRAIDRIFRKAARRSGVEVWDGYARPLLRVSVFLALRDEQTFTDDRVIPS